MTAILSMCLNDGAFVATDAGFQPEDGDAGGPQKRTVQLNRQTAMSGAGYAPAILRTGVELRDRIDDGATRDDVLATTRETVEKVSSAAQEEYPDLDTTFQIVLAGYDAEGESGYVAVIDSPDVEEPRDAIKTDPRQLHVAGTDGELLLGIHSNVQEPMIRQYDGVPLDVWASTVISIAASKDEDIDMPANMVLIDADGYHEAVSHERVTSPDERFAADFE